MLHNAKILASATILAAMFSACDADSTSANQTNKPSDATATTEDTIEFANGKKGVCNEKNDGKIAEIAGGSFRKCEDGEWIKVSKREALDADTILGQVSEDEEDEDIDISSSSNSKSSSSKKTSLFDEDEDEDNSGFESNSSSSKPLDYSVETEDEMPLCSSKREGSSVTVEETGKRYVCEDGEWLLLRSTSKSSSSSFSSTQKSSSSISSNPKSSSSISISTIDEDDFGLGKCTLNRHGEVAQFTLDEQYYICKVGTWLPASQLEIDTYGLTCNAGNVNKDIQGNVQPTNYYRCSASGWTAISYWEYYFGNVHHTGSAESLWGGYYYRVDTGFDDGSDESGYWFSYDDSNNSGNSSLTWATATGNEYDANALDPVIDFCGGLCGTYTLGSGYKYPFVGIGFNITGPDLTGADITAWGGLCLAYSTTGTAPTLELAPENEVNYTECNNYSAKLAVAAEPTVVFLPWSEFKQETGWGVTVPQSEFLTRVAQIRFKISGTAGKTGAFAVYAIGTAAANDCSM